MLWKDLPPEEQKRIEGGGLTLARLAWEYATAVVVAEDGDADTAINTASGFIVELAGKPYLGTAAHVIHRYKERRQKTRYAYLQAGLLGIDALDRIVYCDARSDVAFVCLDGLDVGQADATIYRPVGPWPPVPPRAGDGIQFCGFPKAFRTLPTPGQVDFGALPAFGTVTATGDYYCMSQIERDHVVTLGGEGELPPATGFGGLSGAPVLHFGHLSYPIIGLVSEVAETFGIVRIATLAHLPPFWLEGAA